MKVHHVIQIITAIKCELSKVYDKFVFTCSSIEKINKYPFCEHILFAAVIQSKLQWKWWYPIQFILKSL